MAKHRQKVVLITDKQPSSNPRLVKEAVALSENGYEVTVIYNFWSHWAEEADKNIFNNIGNVKWIRVGGHPISNKFSYWISRLRHKFFKILAVRFTNNLHLQVLAAAQFYPELSLAAGKQLAGLYIAHNLAALPAAAKAAKKNKSKYAFDAEDFHRNQEGVSEHAARSIAHIEDHYFHATQYITAASPLIAAEYGSIYPRKKFTAINNVFSKKFQPPFLELSKSPLKLFWFSQTVGLQRGLQDAISAVNLISDFKIEINILGDASVNTKETLSKLLSSTIHTINFLPPCNEEELINICAAHHIGLALEPGYSLNYRIALTNKVFTYLLAGNALILSDTPAQELFFQENESAAWRYPAGNINTFVEILRQAHNNDDLLNSKRKAAWQLANTTLNWENEQHIFLELVKTVV